MRAVAFVSFVRRMSLVGAFACLAFPALAADPKPDAAVKNRASKPASSSTTRSRPIAALAADCLAEGRKWLDKNAAEAAS